MRRTPLAITAAVSMVVGAYAVVAAAAPRRDNAGTTVEELTRRLQGRGLEGRELVDAATRAVAEAIPYHSAWHLWEKPETSLERRAGWSQQYNTVLLLVLRSLGFDVRLVHAARVRGFGFPWFLSGHTWVKVFVDDRWLDACASSANNRAGEVNFVPLTEELPVYVRTRWAVALALSPFVVARVWGALLTGKRVPQWVYGERKA